MSAVLADSIPVQVVDVLAQKNPELAAARDALIAEKNGAIKYQPMLIDLAASGLGVADATNAARSLADASHKQVIAILKSELLTDPEQVGYAGKDGETLQGLLTTERKIFVDVPAKTGMRELVEGVMATMVNIPSDLAVFDDGTIMSANAEASAELSKRVAIAIGQSGNTEDDLKLPRTQPQYSHTRPPRWGLLTSGIPYCRNLPSLDNIAEAKS